MKKTKPKTKLQRIMFERDISLDELHERTKLANPVLLHIKKGRKIAITEFRERTLIDVEKKGVGVPPKDFLGWEGGKLSQKDFKAPKGKFRVIGIDLSNNEDWIENFDTMEQALEHGTAKKTEVLHTYVYNDKGKRMDKVVEENEDEHEDETISETENKE